MVGIDLAALRRESQQEMKFSDSIKKDWYRHAELVMKYGYLLAEATAEAKKKEAHTKTVYRQLFLVAKRGDATNILGAGKPSDAVCENYAKTRKSYNDALTDCNNAIELTDTLQQIIWSIHARKDALEAITKAVKAVWDGSTEFENIPDAEGLRDYRSILPD